METHTDNNLATPFHEVSLVPFDEAVQPELKAILAEDVELAEISEAEFSDRFFAMLCSVLEKTWNPNKFHVVAHSCGFDSRLIGLAIKRLATQKGKNWLGEILFIEADGEAQEFLECMETEGWEKSQYAVYNAGAHPHVYHHRSFDFSRAWEKLNGVSGYPVNAWWEPIGWAQEAGLIPSDKHLQCFTGYSSNELAKSLIGYWGKGKGPSYYFRWIYYHALSNFPLKGQWIHPFYHFDFIRFLLKHRKCQPEQISLTKSVLPHISPSLASIKYVGTRQKEKTVRWLADYIIRDCINDYQSSWFGKYIMPEIKPFSQAIEYSDWWGFWSLASFCDHLFRTGRIIRCLD